MRKLVILLFLITCPFLSNSRNNSLSIHCKEDNQIFFWTFRLSSYYLTEIDQFNSENNLKVLTCIKKFFLGFEKKDFTEWYEKYYSSEDLLRSFPKLEIKLDRSFYSLQNPSKFLTINNISYMLLGVLSNDYKKMDSIAIMKGFTWDNDNKAYFDTKGNLLMFSFKNRKLNVFSASKSPEILSFYKNQLANKGLKSEIKYLENETVEVYQEDFGGGWILRTDKKKNIYSIELVTAEFSSDFMNFNKNDRLNKF